MSDQGARVQARGAGGDDDGGGGTSYTPGGGVFLSLTKFAEEAGIHRQTVALRVRTAQLVPGPPMRGRTSTHPVYRLRDLLRAVYLSDDAGEADIQRMRPHERLAHLKAEDISLKLASKRGDLIPAFDVEQRQAELCKIMVEFLETLPDVIERDCGAPPMMIARIERRLNEARTELYARMVSSETSTSTENAPRHAGVSP